MKLKARISVGGSRLAVALGVVVLLNCLTASTEAAWQPAKGPLMTRWAKDVKPSKVLPEYPRPQMVREKWENLNGLWDYAIAETNAPQPTKWDGQILVPFPVESALSGVMKLLTEKQRLWYHRTFKVPGSWKGQRVLLHFGAVDWEATVSVNGKELGTHRGGFDGLASTSPLRSSRVASKRLSLPFGTRPTADRKPRASRC